MDWSGVDYSDDFISCLDSHSDGTHSLQRIHWASYVMLHFFKSVSMKKQTRLHLGWPESEEIFRSNIFWGWTIPLILVFKGIVTRQWRCDLSGQLCKWLQSPGSSQWKAAESLWGRWWFPDHCPSHRSLHQSGRLHQTAVAKNSPPQSPARETEVKMDVVFNSVI